MIKVKKIVSLPKLLAKCQKIFNTWIRNRDQDKGCISCPTGQVEQAGHYLSQGHNGALRFNEVNCNGQCVRCNCFLHGNLIEYRKGLIKRYGEEKVLMLENVGSKTRKWSRYELEAIIIMYG